MIIGMHFKVLQTFLGDQNPDPIMPGKPFNAGGDIHGISDGGRFGPVFITDDAHDQVAGMNADADLDGLPFTTFPVNIIFGYDLLDQYGTLQTLVCPLWEDGHDGITDVLVNKAVVLSDGRAYLSNQAVDEAEIIFGGHAFRKAGIFADIKE
jgi:hypothetical protein